MSEEYREYTQGLNDSDEGSTNDHSVELETDNFIWADVQEEIGRFENFTPDMKFTEQEWTSFSAPLQSYIRACRILHKFSLETVAEFILPKMDSAAEPLLDTNVTRKSQSSSKAEQRPVESGKEEIGSSLQRIASGMLRVESASGNMQEVFIRTSKKLGTDRSLATLKTYGVFRSFVENGTWRLAIL